MNTRDKMDFTISQPDWLFTYTDQFEDGQEAQIEYDREGDMLEIFFAKGAGTGLELSDEIVLRYDPETDVPLSLLFITFSKLIEPTEYGIESFQLTGLEHLAAPRQRQILTMLTSAPINRYLHVSAFCLPKDEATEFIPITYIRQGLAAEAQ